MSIRRGFLDEKEPWRCVHGRSTCSEAVKCIDCVPEYAKNDHIVQGYRHNYSYWQASRSLFQLHNETLNVWTHLIGIFIFLYLLFFHVMVVPTSHDRVVLIEQQFEAIKVSHLPPLTTATITLASIERLIQDSMLLSDSWHDFRSNYLADQPHKLTTIVQQFDRTLADLRKHLDSEQASISSSGQISPYLQSKLLTDFHLMQVEINTLANAIASDLDAHFVPIWPLMLYIFSVISCFTFSALFHLYCAVGGEDVHLFWRKLDYTGISVLIAGSYIPIMYYLVELGNFRFFYLLCSFLIASAVIGFTMTDNAYKPEYRTFRVLLYVAFGGFGLIPGLHTIYIISGGHPSQAICLTVFFRLAFMGFLYIFGAFLYIRRFPERLWQGKFDIFLQSHQFFHILVLLAALVHFETCMNLWKLAHYHPLMLMN